MIIGISAKMGCGKTTFANHLIELLGSKWKRISFADALKEEVATIFNFPLEWCYQESGKRHIINTHNNQVEAPKLQMTVRELLQWWGTDVRRKEDLSYWVRKTFERIGQMQENVIIDNVRFPDELDICDLTVRLDPYQGYKPYPNSNHVSETALDDARFNWRTKPEYGQLKYTAKVFVTSMRCQGRL